MSDASGTLLDKRVRVPQHVVYRAFPAETVVLNLETGLYHGLNATGGQMLEVLERADSVRSAVQLLAADYGVPPADVERDVQELCEGLESRGLILLEPVQA
jgi:hypothetical protein